MGLVRLYLEPSERLPVSMRTESFVPVIDCNPEQARDLKRCLVRQGFSVIAVPL
jgi:2-keto-3-deoxy-6-phosphogluconate aldolase